MFGLRPQGLQHRLVEIIHKNGHLHPESLDKLLGVAQFMIIRGVLRIFFEIPALARVRLLRTDDEKLNVPFLILFVQLLDTRNLPAIRQSDDEAELDDNVLLPQEIGEIHLDALGGL
jgi:hypothetical protein